MKKELLFYCLPLFYLFFNFTACQSQSTADAPQFIIGDALPDAPELAARGSFKVGVRTIEVINNNQLDVLNHQDGETPLYDRTLTIEVWYPATLAAGQQELETYQEVMGNFGDSTRPLIPIEFMGRAARDAQPDRSQGPYPLVILSHGYTGSRLMFSYLGENLASKGYVVVSIDHKESTYRDAGPFSSTLYHRSLDQLFTLKEIARLSEKESNHFLYQLADANKTGLIGYSMGGYGALNTLGAGYSARAVGFFKNVTKGSEALSLRTLASDSYQSTQDDRIKAAVAFAPWGMFQGIWDSTALQNVKTPIFFVAGSQDDISRYERGVKAIYEGVKNTNRYMLTYVNARHNVAPNPPYPETLQDGLDIDEYLRYAEPAWDERRINNINQHFITAYLGIHLKGLDYGVYLDLPQDSNAKTWNGFKDRTSVGLELRYSKKQ